MRSKEAEERLGKIRSIKTPYKLNFMGIEISVFEDVYPTSELSELAVEVMKSEKYGIKPGCKILDYGTGTGFIAISAALCGAEVVAIDINPKAIECAKFNAEKNNVYNLIEFRLGNSFDTIKETDKFDYIYAGMPFDNERANDFLEYAMYDPDFKMKKALFKNAKKVLNKNAAIFITYAEFIQTRHPMESFTDEFEISIANSRIIKDKNHFILMCVLK